jgi:hypothetical protein
VRTCCSEVSAGGVCALAEPNRNELSGFNGFPPTPIYLVADDSFAFGIVCCTLKLRHGEYHYLRMLARTSTLSKFAWREEQD